MKSDNLKKIAQLLDCKDYTAAEKQIDALLSDNPSDIDYLFLKGRVSMALNKNDEAWTIFLNLLKQKPTNLNYILSFSNSSVRKGLLGITLACLSKAIELKPDSVKFHKAKILTLEELVKRNNHQYTRQEADAPPTSSHTSKNKEVIILCAGEASRWNSYMGIRQKHLISVEGEVLLERTLNQVLKQSPKKITVLIKAGDNELYQKYCSGKAELVEIRPPQEAETPAWKYLSSENYWNKNGITISLLGDVWFSDQAIERIFQDDVNDWLAFGRTGKSEFTGCPYGEIFSQKFSNLDKHLQSLKLLNDLYLAGLCNAHASGWALCQVISDEDPNIRTAGNNFVEIDDFTEDFDFAEDYERWIAGRCKFNQQRS